MAKVDKGNVYDGDSFKTNSGKHVRLANVNAPETGKPGSVKAADKLESLIGDKNVAIKQVAIDDYGRTVAEVSVDGKSVNNKMNNFLKKK